MQHTSNSSNRRKARQLIYRSMAGAALGIGLLVLPAMAANPIVNTPNDIVDPDDGFTSLREAIVAANEDSGSSIIQFDASLGADPVLTLDAALPSITNTNLIAIDTAAVGSVTITSPLNITGGNVMLNSVTGASQLNADVMADGQSTFSVLSGEGEYGGAGSNSDVITGGGGFGSSEGAGYDGFAGEGVTLTGDVDITESTFNVFADSGGAGGVGGLGVAGVFGVDAGDGGLGGFGGLANAIGNVTANDSTVRVRGGDGAVGGAGGDGQTDILGGFGGYGGFGGDGGNGGDAGITGNITATNSSITIGGGDAAVGGNGGSGNIEDVSEGGTGGDAGYGGDGGYATITGEVDATKSEINLIGGDGANGGNGGSGVAGGYGGDGGFGGGAAIDGALNVTESTVGIGGGDGGAGGISGDNSDSGYGGVGGDADINGIVTASKSTFDIVAGKGGAGGSSGADGHGGDGGAGGDVNIAGNVIADKSTFNLIAGDGGDGYSSSFAGNGGNASITGDVDVTNSSVILLPGEDGYGGNFGFGGDSFIDGNFTANGGSSLEMHTGYFGGFAYTTEDVTLNDNSQLLFSGTPELNFNGGDAITTFGENARLVNLLDFDYPDDNYLTVNHLALNDSQLQPFWTTHESTFMLGQTFDIVNYRGNETGEFGHIYSPLTFDVAYGDGYSGGDITLSISGLDYTQVSGNANQRSLEGYLNRFQDTGQGQIILNQADLPFVLAEMTQQLSQYGPSPLNQWIPDNLAAHNAQTYWNQKSFVDDILANLRNTGHQTGASGFALNQSINLGQSGAQLASLRNALNAPLQGLNANGNGALPASGVWASYYGAHSSTDADHGLGSHAWSGSTDAYTVGYSGGDQDFRWGVAAGHQESNLSFYDVNASGENAGYNGALYAAWAGKSTFLNAVLGYGRYRNDAYGASGDLHFDTKAFSGSLELGKHLSRSKSGEFTPYASLLWTRLKNDNAVDSGSGLTLNSGSSNVYSTALGVRYNRRMYDKSGGLKGGWEAGLAWLHQFGDTDFGANVDYSAQVPGSFRVQTTPLDGNSVQVRLGAYGRIYHNLIGFAGYQGTFGSSQRINAVNAGVGYQF